MRFSLVTAATLSVVSALPNAFPAPAPVDALVTVDAEAQRNSTYLDHQIDRAVSVTCKPIVVIFARGTWEPGGGSGGMLVGDEFISKLKRKFPGKVSSQGVAYGASIGGYLTGGSEGGAATMARMIEQTSKACSSAKIVAGGYSQGGQVVHRAMSKLAASAATHIKAVIIFGDPDKGQKMKNIDPSIVTTICAASDPICKHIPIPLGSHLTYGVKHASQGASDVASTLDKVVSELGGSDN